MKCRGTVRDYDTNRVQKPGSYRNVKVKTNQNFNRKEIES